MSNQEEQQMTEIENETKPKIMTGYIHYGESDDLTKLFDILNEFKNNNGLKYSHQSKAQMVFFNISTEHLEALSKVRPFKISKFKTTTEYKCDEKTSTELMSQKDSFLRMIWNGETGIVSFLSRTPSRVHGNLVRRIFRDSGVEFQQKSYSVQRNFDRDRNVKRYAQTQGQYQGQDQGQDQRQDQGQDQRQDQGQDQRQDQRQGQDQGQDQDRVQTADSAHEGFQRVEKKYRKPRTYPNHSSSSSSAPATHSTHSTYSTHSTRPASKVVKEAETKPKFRGGKPSQTSNKTNV